MRFLLILVLVLSSGFSFAEKEITRSVYDNTKYFMVDIVRNGYILETIYRSSGGGSVSFVKHEVDCVKKKVREMGKGETAENIKVNPKSWTTPINNSVEGDLLKFACRQKIM